MQSLPTPRTPRYRHDRAESVFPIDPDLERPRGAGFGTRSLVVVISALVLAAPALGWLSYRAFTADAARDHTDRDAARETAAARLASVAFSPDGRKLATGGDGVVRIWDLTTGREQAVLRPPWPVVRSLAFSPDGQSLAIVSDRGEIQLWDVAKARRQAVLGAEGPSTIAVELPPSPPHAAVPEQ